MYNEKTKHTFITGIILSVIQRYGKDKYWKKGYFSTISSENLGLRRQQKQHNLIFLLHFGKGKNEF